MDDKLEIERRGVNVSKGVDRDESGLVRITWRIVSDHGDQILVSVSDPIPPDTDVQLPSGDSGDWHESADHITYERELTPKATLTTGYRLDCEDPAAAADAQAPPVVQVGAPAGKTKKPLTRGETDQVASVNDGRSAAPVSPSSSSRGTLDREREDEPESAPDTGNELDQFLETVGEFNAPEDEVSMTDIMSGRADGRDHSVKTETQDDGEHADEADDTTDTGDRPSATVDVDEVSTETPDADRSATDSTESQATPSDSENQPTGDGDDQATEADDGTHPVGGDEGDTHSSGGDTEATANGQPNVTSEDIVDTFIHHLEAGLSEEQATRLQEGLTDAVLPRSSLEVRVMYLQSRFQELSAYIDALEEFIDEHGSGDRILAELTDDVETVQDQLEHGEAELDTLTARVDSTETHTESLETAFESRHHSVDDQLSELESAIEDVRDGQQALDDRVSGLETFRDSLKDAM